MTDIRILLRITLASLAFACLQSAQAADLFWNDDDGIHRNQNADPINPKLLFETFETRGIAIDAVNHRLFWSDLLPIAGPGPGGVIRGGSIQGGAVAGIVHQLPSPSGVAIDDDRARIYWTDLGDSANPSAVYSANLDGSDARRIISAASLSEIAGIAIDTARDKLYFTYINPLIDSLYTGGIARADLDGSHWEPVIGGLGKPVGVAVDSSGKEIYWADAGLSVGQGAIQAGDINGAQRRTILGGLGMPYGVALDFTEKNVYWTDSETGKIQCTGMPGILPAFQDVVTDLRHPTAIAVAGAPIAAPTWSVDMDGNWTTASNWDPRVPNAIGERAIFGSAITAPRTVTVDARLTVGRLEFDNPNSYTIAGFAGLTLNGGSGDAHIQVINGRHTISAPLVMADDVVITIAGANNKLSIMQPLSSGSAALTKAGAGVLEMNSIRAALLSLNGGTISVQPNRSPSILGKLEIAGRASAPIASLDLNNGGLIMDYSSSGANPTTEIRQWIIAGRGGPGLGRLWNGSGITSSQAQADAIASPNSTSVAYGDNDTLPLGQYSRFRGIPIDATSVLIGYTRTADANLDGVVNDDNVTVVGTFYAPGVPKPEWAKGDFDYNGFVDDDNVTLLGVFYNPSAAPIPAPAANGLPAGIAAVPEPATVVLLVIGVLLISVPKMLSLC